LRSQANAEREADRARSREQYLQAEILQEQYNHQRRMNQLAQIEKENAIEAMRQAEAEHARQQLLQIASPFEEVFASLRRQLAEDAEEMLVSIRKNGFVRGKVAEKGRGLLEFFDLLAVHQDDELRNRLVALRQALGTAGERRSASESERNTAHVASLLQDIAGLAHSAAQDLSAGPSRFSLIE